MLDGSCGCHLRYALKMAADPQRLFEQESEKLCLNNHFKSLLEPFVPTTTEHT
jgi:hypothetical protein